MKQLKMNQKNKKVGLLGIFGASLWGILLTGKGVKAKITEE